MSKPVYKVPAMRIRIATTKRKACLLLRYGTVASGSHTVCFDPSRYFKVEYDNVSMIVFKYVVYDSRISVARVATGFFLPMILENLTDLLDIIITAMTSTIT